MNIDEIYSTLSAHMIKGVMIHEQLANYYDFLGLGGYKRCHEYHSIAEMCVHRGLNRYYINHHNRLIGESEIENPDIIPTSWYQHARQDVDANTKRNAVKNGLSKWVDWELDTKELYERMYKEALDIGEVASACKIKQLVDDVDRELKNAERYQLNKEATGYDMTVVIEEQAKKHKKYSNKLRQIGITIC